MGWTIGRLFGIPVRLHFTMILVPFITYNWMPVRGLFDILVWASLVVLLFGSVLLHELGHALTARRFGIHTQDIVLTPIGGIARVTNMPRNPKQEIAIAVAGPIVSLVLAAIGFVLLLFMIPFLSVVSDAAIQGATLFFRINLMLALFNLIPALPMDGGRVLRGILALKRDHLSATRIAVRIGRGLALLGGGYALMDMENRFNVGLISVFIYIAAGSELRMAELRAAQERARAQGGGMPFGFPFGGGGRPFTWTWRSGGAAVQEEDGFERPAPLRDPDWSTARTERERDAVIIGGKAEIVGRRDPKKE